MGAMGDDELKTNFGAMEESEKRAQLDRWRNLLQGVQQEVADKPGRDNHHSPIKPGPYIKLRLIPMQVPGGA